MAVRQVTVFIANKEGRIEKVTEILNENGINIISLSLAESADFGLLRLIVQDPEKAKCVLKDSGLSAKTTNVIAVSIPNVPGSLHTLLTSIKDFNIEYMYVLTSEKMASMILKIRDIEAAEEHLRREGFTLLSEEKINESFV